jgi:hypothetical protein
MWMIGDEEMVILLRLYLATGEAAVLLDSVTLKH